MLNKELKQLTKKLLNHGLILATAESCTGGWVAQMITSMPGSSKWFERGFVTYSNAAKQELLSVSHESLKKFGAVSEQVAREMVEGVLQHSHADVAISTTGIAGPDGGTAEKPVGTVCFAFARKKQPSKTTTQHFSGDRQQIRKQAVEFVLRELVVYIG